MCGLLCCGQVCLLHLIFERIGPPVGVNVSVGLGEPLSGGVTTLGGESTVGGGNLGGVTTLGGGTVDEVKGVVSGAGVGATLTGM